MGPTGLEVGVGQPVLLQVLKGDGFWPHWGARPSSERPHEGREPANGPYIVCPCQGQGELGTCHCTPKHTNKALPTLGPPSSMILQWSLMRGQGKGRGSCYPPTPPCHTLSSPRRERDQCFSRSVGEGKGLGTGFHLSVPRPQVTPQRCTTASVSARGSQAGAGHRSARKQTAQLGLGSERDQEPVLWHIRLR